MGQREDLRNALEIRGEALNVISIESLAGFDEQQVNFLSFPALDLQFLAVSLSESRQQRSES
jgi:hypothetical protein